MHFCKSCNNMYYMKETEIDDKPVLIYECKKCGDTNTDLLSNLENLIVSTTNIKKSEQKYHHIVNKYTKLDPTLPRIYNIECPNAGCSSNAKDETKTKNEIIYMRYDDKNMKYIYVCTNCDTIWRNNKNI